MTTFREIFQLSNFPNLQDKLIRPQSSRVVYRFMAIIPSKKSKLRTLRSDHRFCKCDAWRHDERGHESRNEQSEASSIQTGKMASVVAHLCLSSKSATEKKKKLATISSTFKYFHCHLFATSVQQNFQATLQIFARSNFTRIFLQKPD